jgi:tRNA A-37 threonylcarbamoyl transferase component Bud32
MAQPQTIGRYEIVAVLGHGAMGAVYQAQDPKMDRTVAIKTILATALSGPLADEYRERFIREARAAGRLTHNGIVTVYDVGEDNDIPYLVMEYVNGRSLATAMETGDRFNFDRIYELGFQVADALGYAHRHGVVHRDVKPANILLATPAPGELERAKIADLGVAKLAASQITTTGQLLGTPAFMAPEQFTGAPIDGRADLFSLGVIVYWLATGDKPFGGDTITAVSYKIVNVEPPMPRRLNPAVPVALEKIIMRCLEKDPAARYPSGEALAADLAAARAGHELGQSSAAGLAGILSASGGILPAGTNAGAGMSGDPNTTLDSDVRLQMAAAKRRKAPVQKPVSARLARQFSWPQLQLNVYEQRLLAAVAIGLIFMASIWGIARHRRNAALARQVQAQMESGIQGEQTSPAQDANAVPQTAVAPAQTPLPSDAAANQAGAAAAPPSGDAASKDSAAAAGGASSAVTPNAEVKNSPPKTASTKSRQRQAKPTPQETDTNTAASSVPPAGAANTDSASTVVAPPVEQTPPPAPANPAPTQVAAATPSAATPPAGPEAADAARLHIDDGRLPNSVSFMVLMDGQVLFQRGALPEGQDHPAREDILIRAGDHEFRVVAAAGTVAIGDSNTVRQEFKSKKKKNLRIEMRDAASGQTVKKTAHVDPQSSVFNIELRDAGGFLGVH